MGKKKNEDLSANLTKVASVRLEEGFFDELKEYEINISEVSREALERALIDAKLKDHRVWKIRRVNLPDGSTEITLKRSTRDDF